MIPRAASLRWFAPQPAAAELPARLASPFEQGPPHPLARRAADELVVSLRDVELTDGKMFGVLVVAAPDGQIGYLRAFSGMLGGRWDVDGFAPPLFDPIARDAVWPAGEAELRVLEARHRALEPLALRARVAELAAQRDAAATELRDRHRANRLARRAARGATSEPAALHALDQASRADTAERRRFDQARDADAEALVLELQAIDDQRAALDHERTERSRALLWQIYDSYIIANARGERRLLRALFAPDAPPGGSGDCAAPKLLGEAFAHDLRPLALAELWWGPPPVSGGRHAGVYYPACRGKCGVILPYMLEGTGVAPAPVFPSARVADDEPRIVYEDRWLVVVDKPCGLLSVPGRSGQLRDSVVTRLQQRDAGLSVVHRLDLDTSGLLLAAKDVETHAALQRQFALREIDKRYIAWLDGSPAADGGTIELALRVDLDDRPRQIHDAVRGKPAVTEWRVLERRDGRTRVALIPRTGRTHQLRVHAAHARGLAAPIVGDRLYGRDAGDEPGRLLLHAEALVFVHPHSGARIELERPAPF